MTQISKTVSTCLQRRVRRLIIDSGAHSLYTHEIAPKARGGSDRFSFFETNEFWNYVDDYAQFLVKHKKGIDFYVNVDVIFNPELSYKVLKYLEKHYHLTPIPVIHYGTEIKWLKKHIDEGYDYIGIGGLGQEAKKSDYYHWADRVFDYICPRPKRIPIVKTHGFAMTSYELMLRYPWFSTDSVSWAKTAGFGGIFVPHKRNGVFTFEEEPYVIAISSDSSSLKVPGRHYKHLSHTSQKIIREWLEEIDMPFGTVNKTGHTQEWGVVSEYEARAIANLTFFELLLQWLPKWPCPFKIQIRKGFFD